MIEDQEIEFLENLRSLQMIKMRFADQQTKKQTWPEF